ncbi:hypothetical protein GCM10017044_11770 [Kordiimonas sediminis]|uniref:HTH hxlR-type domain-containing protein n=1 Tax=Kordiimonas sediminis TaxID=1735581 RepID=A0A919E728_9PROT|nr:helix-turn-helix domain-containing protein [Kordiimonas sediminis]GHF18874.1 hypothetical protein GCM10017044_11770 [Kordiimonas sediminis]
MKWQNLSDERCSIARALAVIGDRWTLLILRECFAGTMRFDDFKSSLGISRTMLSDRLGKLVDSGVLTKVSYQEKPTRYEYALTDKGMALFPVMMTITGWGDAYCFEEEGTPKITRHSTCGHAVVPKVVCSSCGGNVTPHNTSVEAPKKRDVLTNQELPDIPDFLRTGILNTQSTRLNQLKSRFRKK